MILCLKIWAQNKDLGSLIKHRVYFSFFIFSMKNTWSNQSNFDESKYMKVKCFIKTVSYSLRIAMRMVEEFFFAVRSVIIPLWFCGSHLFGIRMTFDKRQRHFLHWLRHKWRFRHVKYSAKSYLYLFYFIYFL